MEENLTLTPLLPHQKSNLWVWIGVCMAMLGVGIGIGLFFGKQIYFQNTAQINSYDQCIAAKGSSLQESNPPICVTINGLRFKGPISSPTLTPDPTANWKTYTNPSLGYSFSYPQNTSIEVYGDSTVIRIDPPELRTIVGGCQRWISFSSAGSGSSAKTTQDKYGCVYNAFVSEEKVFVESQYSDGSQKIVDQILSTFRFVDTLPEKTNDSFCGGIAGIICPEGYKCKYDGSYPDASGVCVKN